MTPRWLGIAQTQCLSLLKHYIGSVFQGRSEYCHRETHLLDSRSPHAIAHLPLVGVVVIRLGAVGPTDVVVLVVHAVLCLVLGLWVDVAVVLGSRRRESLLTR
jgi:hypothetical protein